MKIEKAVSWSVLAALLTGHTLLLRGAEPNGLAGPIWPAAASPIQEVTLQDDQTSVAFDADTGALTRLEDKTAHWTVERRPELGVSFRLFAPMLDRRWNPVLGQKQRATEVKKISDNEIRIRWEHLVGESSGVLPISLAADITLTNGVVTFHATLKNDSALTVETVDYPYFGDFNAPTRETTLQARVTTTNQSTNYKVDEIYPHFRNEKGYWGDFWPLKTREAQQSHFCLIAATNEGVQVEIPAAPYQLQWTFEQHPGVITSISALVPQEDEIAGTPVHLEFRACHFIFAKPQATVELTPVALRFYQGDWHAGVDLDKPQGSAGN